METKKQLIEKMKRELTWTALPRCNMNSCTKQYLQEMYDSAQKLGLTVKPNTDAGNMEVYQSQNSDYIEVVTPDGSVRAYVLKFVDDKKEVKEIMKNKKARQDYFASNGFIKIGEYKKGVQK